MDVVLNRRAVRRTAAPPGLCALPVLCFLLWAPVTAAAQEFDASARQTVQRAAQEAAGVVSRAVDDRTHTVLHVEPVRTDTGRVTRLGARLRGVLQVALLRHYRNARLLDQADSGLAASAVRVAVELQPFDHQVTALVRVLDRDGLLIGAGLVDLPRSTAVSALLQPGAWPAEAEPAAGERMAADAPAALRPDPAAEQPYPPEPSGEEAPAPAGPPAPMPEEPAPLPEEPAPPAEPQSAPSPDLPAAPAPADDSVAPDSYEPDDQAGFEVPVPAGADVRFERTLTGDDRDRFELQLPAPSSVTVVVDAEIDTLIALYLAGDAVPIGVTDRRFTGVLEAGAYVIEVMTADAAATGAYRMAVSTAPDPAQTAGDAPAADPAPPPGAALPPSSAAPAVETVDTAELHAGESQERLVRQTTEWLQLIADPGFYGVTVASAAGTVRASLHRAPGEPPFLELAPSADGEQAGALFVGADLPVVRIDAPESALGLLYSVTLERAAPPRVFADQRWTEQAEVGALKHHTLRIFSRDVYAMSLESGSAFGSAAFAEATVYQIPGMIPTLPQEPGVGRFDLPASDYLVLVRALDQGAVGRVCWHLAQGEANCS